MTPFTHVSIKLAAGENLMTADEWEALPLSDKTSSILKKKATFMQNDKIISIQEILSYMKEAS